MSRLLPFAFLLGLSVMAGAQPTSVPATRPADERLAIAETALAADDMPKAVANLEYWPSIGSGARRFRRHVGPERAALAPRERALAELTLSKIAAFEKANLPLTHDNLQQRFVTYTKLSNLTESASGYGNLLLRDTVRKLLVEHLGSYLVAHPEEVKTLLEWRYKYLRYPTFIPQRFASAAWQESRHGEDVKRAAERLEGEQAAIAIATVFDTTGEALMWQASDAYETRGLLDEVSLEGTLYRLVETDVLLTCYVDALADYLVAGGKLADITTNGDSWAKLMKDRRGRYHSAFLNVQVSDLHLAKFIAEHRSLENLTTRGDEILK